MAISREVNNAAEKPDQTINDEESHLDNLTIIKEAFDVVGNEKVYEMQNVTLDAETKENYNDLIEGLGCDYSPTDRFEVSDNGSNVETAMIHIFYSKDGESQETSLLVPEGSYEIDMSDGTNDSDSYGNDEYLDSLLDQSVNGIIA